MSKTIDIRNNLSFKLAQLSQKISRDIGQEMAEFGVTASQWNVIAVIASKRAQTPSSIAEFLDADGGAVSRHLDTLEKKNLIQRLPSPADRRSITVQLTETGQQLIPRLADAARTVEERYCARLSEDELKRLEELLGRLSGDVVLQQHSAEDWEIS